MSAKNSIELEKLSCKTCIYKVIKILNITEYKNNWKIEIENKNNKLNISLKNIPNKEAERILRYIKI